jgi:peroxiredoxin
LRSFQNRLSDFESRGIRVAAVSADPVETNREHRPAMAWTFTLLSDPSTETIRRWDLLHVDGSPEDGEIARPAEFLIDPSGTVRWRDLTEDYWKRARPETVLARFDELVRTPPP